MGGMGLSGSQMLTLTEQQKHIDGQGDVKDAKTQVFGLVEGCDALSKQAMGDPNQGDDGGDASGLGWGEGSDEGR